jgi:hypothetical protein
MGRRKFRLFRKRQGQGIADVDKPLPQQPRGAQAAVDAPLEQQPGGVAASAPLIVADDATPAISLESSTATAAELGDPLASAVPEPSSSIVEQEIFPEIAPVADALSVPPESDDSLPAPHTQPAESPSLDDLPEALTPTRVGALEVQAHRAPLAAPAVGIDNPPGAPVRASSAKMKRPPLPELSAAQLESYQVYTAPGAMSSEDLEAGRARLRASLTAEQNTKVSAAIDVYVTALGHRDPFVDATALRFLVAHNWNETKAHRHLKSTAAWRNAPYGGKKETTPAQVCTRHKTVPIAARLLPLPPSLLLQIRSWYLSGHTPAENPQVQLLYRVLPFALEHRRTKAGGCMPTHSQPHSPMRRR